MKFILTIAFFLQLAVVIFAQNVSLPLQITLQRQNDFTFSNKYDLNVEKKYKKYTINALSHHDNIYNSVLNKPFVQIYFQHQIWQYYEIKPKLRLVSWIDAQQFLHNQNFRISVYKGIAYKPKDFLTITPLIGYSWDRLNNILNQGLSPALMLASDYVFKDGTHTFIQAFGREKFLNPRHQRNISIKSGLEKDFEGKASFAMTLNAGSHEIDNFKGNSIEKIISDSLGTAVQVQYQPLPYLQFLSENQFLWSKRSFDYKIYKVSQAEFNDLQFVQNEFRTNEKVSFYKDRWTVDLSYGFEYSDRNYSIENNTLLSNLLYKKLREQEELKNFKQQAHNIEINISKEWRKNRLFMKGYNRYVLYDTPSENNYDDHDELIHSVQGEWQIKWRKNFSTQYKLEGNRRQYAFLFKEKSRDNYTQYMLRAEFEGKWQPSEKWDFKATQWIYVTYNVKDFQDLTFSNRSTRNLETRINGSFTPNKRWQLQSSFYRKEIYVSYLDWANFAESTLDTTRTFILEEKNEYNLFPKSKTNDIYLNIGYKHFSLFKFQNALMYDNNNILVPINLHKRNFQTGIITGLKWNRKKQFSFLDFSVWWQYQRQDNLYTPIGIFPSTLVSYQESELQRVSVAIRPYWDIKINFKF